MTKDDARCSWCKRTKEIAGVLVVGINAAVCASCLKGLQGPEARIAYCHACCVMDGKHAANCKEEGAA